MVYGEMSTAEFNHRMEIGLAQAKADDSYDIDEVFDELFDELESGLK